MKTRRSLAGWIGMVCLLAGTAQAADWYVATNGNDSADGTNWFTAKLTIQTGIDVSSAGDTVWVSNGVYATGGRVAGGGNLTNRVAIDQPITVQSVNGPEVTTLVGTEQVGGPETTAARCAYLVADAVLSGFTLTNGGTGYGGGSELRGGGAYCESGGILTHCIIQNNDVGDAGGGVYGGTLFHCTLNANSASNMFGGGARSSILNSCIIVSNFAWVGGGASDCELNDCLIIDNDAFWHAGGVHVGTLNNCTVAGNTAAHDGSGGGAYGSTVNNCIVYDNSAPIDPNISTSTVQCSCTTPNPGGTGNITNDPQFVDAATGDYRLQTNSPCINGGDNDLVEGDTDLDGNPRIAFGLPYGRVDMGSYEFLSTARYVAQSGSDVAAGTNWATAKLTIQNAVDEADNSDMVIVSNGVYSTGGRPVGVWALTNRVAIDRPITVRSFAGAGVTWIQGAWDPLTTNGDAAVRCAYVGTNAMLVGFTLTNGATLASGENDEQAGGGVYCGNSGALNNCILAGNSASFCGGGVIGGTLNQCLIVGNFALGYGGGGVSVNLNNCTVVDNSAGIDGGGLHSAQAVGNDMILLPANNSIVYGNSAPSGANYALYPFVNSCTTPDPGGTGNIIGDPQFVDAASGNYRLLPISPCIDAGDNGVVYGELDLDGNPRIAYGTVDIGAYEAQLTGAGTWFTAITNGLTNDLECVAGDGIPNLLKYATGSSPRISDDLMLLGWVLNDGVPTLVLNRNTNATDVVLTLEGADEMIDDAVWRGLATNINGSWGGAVNVSESATGEPVVVTVTDPVALESNRFLRLKVTRP